MKASPNVVVNPPECHLVKGFKRHRSARRLRLSKKELQRPVGRKLRRAAKTALLVVEDFTDILVRSLEPVFVQGSVFKRRAQLCSELSEGI